MSSTGRSLEYLCCIYADHVRQVWRLGRVKGEVFCHSARAQLEQGPEPIKSSPNTSCPSTIVGSAPDRDRIADTKRECIGFTMGMYYVFSVTIDPFLCHRFFKSDAFCISRFLKIEVRRRRQKTSNNRATATRSTLATKGSLNTTQHYPLRRSNKVQHLPWPKATPNLLAHIQSKPNHDQPPAHSPNTTASRMIELGTLQHYSPRFPRTMSLRGRPRNASSAPWPTPIQECLQNVIGEGSCSCIFNVVASAFVLRNPPRPCPSRHQIRLPVFKNTVHSPLRRAFERGAFVAAMKRSMTRHAITAGLFVALLLALFREGCEGNCTSSLLCEGSDFDCLYSGCDPVSMTEEATCEESWKGDSWCDEINNNPSCDYDGGDVSL